MANCSMSTQIIKPSVSHQVRDCYKALSHMLGNRHHFAQGPMLYRRLIDFIMCLAITLLITTIEAQPNQVTYVSLFGNAHNF